MLYRLQLEKRDRQIAAAKQWKAVYSEEEKLNVYMNEDTGEVQVSEEHPARPVGHLRRHAERSSATRARCNTVR